MIRELPDWVYDLVNAMLKWNEEHPELYIGGKGSGYLKSPLCGCHLLGFVPEDIKLYAGAFAAGMAACERKHLTDVSGNLSDAGRNLSDALGLSQADFSA